MKTNVDITRLLGNLCYVGYMFASNRRL